MAKYVGFKTGKIHEKHIYSEYYCGGCGYPVTDHDSYCPECGGAFRKCDSDDYISKKETNNMNKIIEWLYAYPGISISLLKPNNYEEV